MRKFIVPLIMSSFVVLAGCSALPFSDRFGKGAEEKRSAADAAALADKPEVPADSLLNAGIRNLNTGNFEKAQKAFSEIGKQHPFSKEAERSLVLSAYSHFTEGEYDETVSKAERFIQLYPGSDDAAYMQYLIGESHFKQQASILLDQEETRKGLRAYSNLVRLYPESKYVENSKAKMIFLNDQLAGKEMQIGRYYQEKNQHLAAVNRFRGVAEQFQETRHIEEALYRLTESYLALGIVNEAQTAGALLGYNYPDSSWYKDAYSLLTGRALEPRVGKSSRLARLIPFGGKDEKPKKEKETSELPVLSSTQPISPVVGTSAAVLGEGQKQVEETTTQVTTAVNQSVENIPGLAEASLSEDALQSLPTSASPQEQISQIQPSSIPRQAASELVNADSATVISETANTVSEEAEAATEPEKKKRLSRFIPFVGKKDQ